MIHNDYLGIMEPCKTTWKYVLEYRIGDHVQCMFYEGDIATVDGLSRYTQVQL